MHADRYRARSARSKPRTEAPHASVVARGAAACVPCLVWPSASGPVGLIDHDFVFDPLSSATGEHQNW